VKKYRHQQIRYVYQFFEQSFLNTVVEEIHDALKNGGCLLQFGCEESVISSPKIYSCFPILSHIVMDNEGANKCLGIFTGVKCRRPCRLCLKDYGALHQPGRKLKYRNMGDHFYTLSNASRALKQKWSKSGTLANSKVQKYLKKAQFHSLHVARNCLMEFYVHNPEYNSNCYHKCPPDEMHTILGGILKDWIFWTAIVLQEVGKLDSRYETTVAKMDNKLKLFNNRNLPETLQRFTFHQVNP